ncbi:MaoC family dehydratase [Nocardia carnea]|uniref:MaoC family dehydratase n=1 Tax=Nocardia carnea TaxID=37328 RepID=UPI0024579C8B|nr:MaoC family dehydratase [Nocardia carnea]
MSTAVVAHGLQDLRDLLGRHLGYSEWIEIAQDRVSLFADATGDHQWIHVDTDRAAESPFGGLVAHGFLTLSLLPTFIPQVLVIKGFSAAVNYGTDKVRFPAPVPVGSFVRGGLEVASVEEVRGGVQLTVVVTVEVQGRDKPACVAHFVTRHLH